MVYVVQLLCFLLLLIQIKKYQNNKIKNTFITLP